MSASAGGSPGRDGRADDGRGRHVERAGVVLEHARGVPRRGGAAAGIALINSLGNLAGFTTNNIVGWLAGLTGSNAAGLYLFAAVMAVSGALILAVPGRLVNK